jgi:hypothetical protein
MMKIAVVVVMMIFVAQSQLCQCNDYQNNWLEVHEKIKTSLEQQVGTGRTSSTIGSSDLLVVNVVNVHYGWTLKAWYEMVKKANFQKEIFIVTMDEKSTYQAKKVGIPHYAISSEGSSSGGDTSVDVAKGTRILPTGLGTYKFHVVTAGLSNSWRVLMSESDVIWNPQASFLSMLDTSKSYQFVASAQSVYNFGFFLARGDAMLAMFKCICEQWSSHSSDLLAADQAYFSGVLFLKDEYPCRKEATEISHHSLSRDYSLCGSWVSNDLSEVAHLTFCGRLDRENNLHEEACKSEMLHKFYSGEANWTNIVSKEWNMGLACHHSKGWSSPLPAVVEDVHRKNKKIHTA